MSRMANVNPTISNFSCLELAYTICVSHGFYLMSIQHRGHPIVREPGSLRVAGILGAIVDFLVQVSPYPFYYHYEFIQINVQDFPCESCPPVF